MIPQYTRSVPLRGRRFGVLLLLHLTIASAPLGIAKDAPKVDAEELKKVLSGVDKLWSSKKSEAEMTMTVKTAHYERALKLTLWAEGDTQALVKINAPAKEKGTMTLRLGHDIYNFLPKIDRTVKVSAAMRTSSWMGSHFSNDDLVGSCHLAKDYDATLVEANKHGKTTLWTVDLVPKSGTNLTWSKLRLVVEKERTIPISQTFYNERGSKTRTVIFSDVKELGGRQAPTKISVTPADLPGEHTDLVYVSLRHDIKLDPDFFNVDNLKSH